MTINSKLLALKMQMRLIIIPWRAERRIAYEVMANIFLVIPVGMLAGKGVSYLNISPLLKDMFVGLVAVMMMFVLSKLNR
ncbi:hypothetical protein COO59_15080 [Mixta theicola]|uniref:Uncharacterized protein n=1 Tax=Mixta theicola TaxID=1458355 RepID=A0A2K1Q7C2_9GAMM|nr:hypothetical protein [Mixta theicola]PNS10930.1 hypothetical protein COO59_15080 [Mixta theicola]GLR11094.1 hypothetical protein GCM10007905_38140 [Mixta theicola]